MNGEGISFLSTSLEDLVLPHQVQVDARTGAATTAVAIPITPGRSGFQPSLKLAYNSTSGNSVYGVGWRLSGLPSVSLNLKDGLPHYDNSDKYVFAGGELVPWLEEGYGRAPRIFDEGEHWVHFYRSKLEGAFNRIEKWVHKATQRIHWRVTDRNDVISVFGLDISGLTRIADPADPARTFEWFLEWQYDLHGNAIYYQYTEENAENVKTEASFERSRIFQTFAFPQRYLTHIHYGNTHPLAPGDSDPGVDTWLFSIVLDYGERAAEDVPAYEAETNWPARLDPFSTYKPGFEVRTYRLCRQFLMFHRFQELGAGPTLVGSFALNHQEDAAGSTIENLQYTRFRRNADDNTYSQKSLPPVLCQYSRPAVGHTFLAAPEVTTENSPYGLGAVNYRWIDLHGEGLPGILFETQQSWYYKPNLGGGRLGPQQKVADKPSAQPGQYAFSDFDGDGNLNLVILQGREAGFFAYNRDEGTWGGFCAFTSSPHVRALDTKTQLLDLDGDGLADIVTIEQDRIIMYPSKGRDGFDAPVEISKPLTNGVSRAPTIGSNLSLDYFFIDMTGDGLLDQVKIQNGRVEYWPQLGNGKFGTGVVMEDAPVLDFENQLDASRIRLVDLDGSGTADLLYIGRGEIRYWINASGNRFIEGGTIRGLPYIDNLSSAQVIDFLGDGTPHLVWSTALPGQSQTPLHYLPLTSSVKPRLLTTVDNSMGRRMQVVYGHSASHYLRDHRAGQPWISKLPQHTTVVNRLITIDQIGNNRTESLYKYHDGFFDGEEDVFVFGLVDQYDSNTYQGSATIPVTDHADPVCVRTWFHNGAIGWESKRVRDFYHRDPKAAILPPTFVENRNALNSGEFEEAIRSLTGQVLRTEVYGLDNDGQRNPHPYQVTQTNFRIRRLQPKTEDDDPSFVVFPSESLNYIYEQNSEDPRIAHNLTLDIDDYGNVRRSCSVAYPRRHGERGDAAAQAQLHVTVSETNLLNVDQDLRYQLAIPLEDQTFEVAGHPYDESAGTDTLLQLDVLTAELDSALRPDRLLRFDQSFTDTGVQARLQHWTRYHYWNEARSTVLPWPQVGVLPLIHHTESACCTDELMEAAFATRLDPRSMREEGLYGHHDNYWWLSSPTLHYRAQNEFNLLDRQIQIVRTEDRVVDAITQFRYDDPYWLNLISITDPIGNQVAALNFDYHHIAPDQIRDPNENIAEVRYDELGVAVVSTQYGRILNSTGSERDYGNEPLAQYRLQSDATLENILTGPERFLQEASTFQHYDLDTWANASQQPLRSITLLRESFVYDGESNEPPDNRIQIQISYLDGFGRILQTKTLVEPGPAVQIDADGRLMDLPWAYPRFRVSGHAVYNTKQQLVRQYEPYFSITPAFESHELLETFGQTTITEYDPLGRATHVHYPNGTRTQTEYQAWETIQHDPNDTVMDSPYEDIRNRLPDSDPEKEALRKAQEHAHTPTRIYLDPLGREVERLEDGGSAGIRRTETRLDFAGNPSEIIQVLEPQPLTAFTYRRDMLGRVFYERSMDAGEKWSFTDALDQPIHLWDSRQVHQRLDYDQLGRVLSIFVDGALGLNQYTERMVYGDNPEELQAALRNLRGQLISHFDQAGVLNFHRYDPAGQPLRRSRQLLQDYKNEPDWNDQIMADPTVVLEDTTYETRLRYDALGRVIWHHLADGSTRHIDYQQGGGIGQVRVSTADGIISEMPFLNDAAYNARGQRTGALLGNDVAIRYEYDPLTYRMSRLYARQLHPDDVDPFDTDPRAPEYLARRVYQDIRYTYDPAGNLVYLVDHAQEAPQGDVLSRLRGEVRSTSRFTYDAFYQLREATGRVHEALQQNDYNAGNAGQPAWIKGTRHVHLNNAQAVRRYTRTYDYDLRGNIIRLDHYTHLPARDIHYRSDMWISMESNRSLPTHDLNNLPVTNPENRFDENGNCLYLPHLHRFAWNYRNYLAHAVTVSRADDPDALDDAEYYIYGSDGQRVRKVHEQLVNGDGQEITEKIYLDGCEIKRIRNHNRLVLERMTSHISDGSERIALLHQWTLDRSNRETDDINRKGIHYQLSNHLGSSSLELNEEGEVISYEEYFPFGGTAFIAGRASTNGRRLEQEVRRKDYRYSGKERDDVTGLYYYGYRYYVPWLGRWLSPDPIGPGDGANLYQFVRNNPINLVDPNGLQADDITIAIPERYNRQLTDQQRQSILQGTHVLVPTDESASDNFEIITSVEAERRDINTRPAGFKSQNDDATSSIPQPFRLNRGQFGEGLNLSRPSSGSSPDEAIDVGQLGRRESDSGQPDNPDQLAADLADLEIDGLIPGGRIANENEELSGQESDAREVGQSGLGGPGNGLGQQGSGLGGGGTSENIGIGLESSRQGSGAGAVGTGTGPEGSTTDGLGARGRINGNNVNRQPESLNNDAGISKSADFGESNSGRRSSIPRLPENGDDGSRSGIEGSSGQGGLAIGSNTTGSRLGTQGGQQQGSLLSGGEGGTEVPDFGDDLTNAIGIATGEAFGYDPDDPDARESGIPGGVLGWLDFGETANQSLYVFGTALMLIFGTVNALSSAVRNIVRHTTKHILKRLGKIIKPLIQVIPKPKRLLGMLDDIWSGASSTRRMQRAEETLEHTMNRLRHHVKTLHELRPYPKHTVLVGASQQSGSNRIIFRAAQEAGGFSHEQSAYLRAWGISEVEDLPGVHAELNYHGRIFGNLTIWNDAGEIVSDLPRNLIENPMAIVTNNKACKEWCRNALPSIGYGQYEISNLREWIWIRETH